MISILRQPPNDEFTLRLFLKIVNDLNASDKKFDAFYIWSLVLSQGGYENKFSLREQDKRYIIHSDPNDPSGVILDPNYYKRHIVDSISNELVLLGIKDHLTNKDFNPWIDSEPGLVYFLTDIFEAHKDKQFILFTSLENLEAYINYKNVKIVPWGGDITNQMSEYDRFVPSLDKNFNSNKVFLNLNRNQRAHRVHALSLILGLDLEKQGLISCMFAKDLHPRLESHGWRINKAQDLFNYGYQKVLNYNFDISDSYDIYPNLDNNNFFNFENSLRNYYKETFVEIISETSYNEECFLITEKTANCFLGCNFPIWISSKGTVKFLRSFGFDVFDDIIDHSYDEISNPVDRLYAALTDNIEILKNIDQIKMTWKANQYRFLKNIAVLKRYFFKRTYERAYQSVIL